MRVPINSLRFIRFQFSAAAPYCHRHATNFSLSRNELIEKNRVESSRQSIRFMRSQFSAAVELCREMGRWHTEFYTKVLILIILRVQSYLSSLPYSMLSHFFIKDTNSQ